jgi:16S rRNA (adenine1518-N6/adenine1519-N6)-dimethyltransferase
VPRRLGQHFLRPASVERLLATIAPRPDETFLEIGPGAGALTFPLARAAGRVVAVELDGALAARLRERAPANLTVVHGDALREDLAALVPPGSRLAGNLPYYVSSPLLRRFLALRDHVRDAHVMLQEEVARRGAAPPGSKEYGILSVLYALWAEVDIPLRFGPGAFVPPPKVSSALLRARFRAVPSAEVTDLEAFERVVLAAFGRRRRTLENNLRDSYPNLKENLRLLNIEGSRRAETLSVVEFARLSRALRRAMPA